MSQLDPSEVRTLLDVHQSLVRQAASLATMLKPHLLQVGDKVTASEESVHEVVAVKLDENGYGVELGKSYCGGGFVLRGDCVKKVSPLDQSANNDALEPSVSDKDIALVNTALNTGQISAAKVDAQRAFLRIREAIRKAPTPGPLSTDQFESGMYVRCIGAPDDCKRYMQRCGRLYHASQELHGTSGIWIWNMEFTNGRAEVPVRENDGFIFERAT